MTFVDTADVYSAGESQVIVGKALARRRDDIVLATKAFMPMSDNLNHRGSSRLRVDPHRCWPMLPSSVIGMVVNA
jgi:aryl-alcohol dehydrogenase-like predicted oxidoreductase